MLAQNDSPLLLRSGIFRVLHEITLAVAGVLDPALLAQLVVDRSCSLLEAEAGALYLWDDEASALRMLYGNHVQVDPRMPMSYVGQGTSLKAFAAREPVVVQDYARWKGHLKNGVNRGLKGVVAVPLLVNERAIGSLVVRFYHPHTCCPDECTTLALLAAQVAPAIEAAHLLRLSEEARGEAEALADLVRRAASESDSQGVADLFAEHVAHAAGADYAVIVANSGSDRPIVCGTRGTQAAGWHEAHEARGLGIAGPSPNRPVLRPVEVQFLENQRALDMHRAENAVMVLAIPIHTRLTTEDAPEALVLGWRRDVKLAPGRLKRCERIASHIGSVLDSVRTHASLVASDEERRRTYAAVACGLLLRSAAGEILQANPAALDILGIDLKTVQGRRPEECWKSFSEAGPELTPEKHPGFEALRRGRAVRGRIMRIVRPDQQERWIQVDSVPILGLDGRATKVISSFLDVTARRRAEQQLAHRALHDDLTDLPNRTLLKDRLDQAVLTLHRYQRPMSLMIMDLDQFKLVNDSLGHACGDELLRQVASRIRAAVRASDTVARLGGDEFAVILPAADQAAASRLALQLIRMLDAPVMLDGKPLSITMSIGIATAPEHGQDAEALLRHADAAMYLAKRHHAGFATYVNDTTEDTSGFPERLSLASDLRQAIDHDQLTLHYQPQIRYGGAMLLSAEALVRWQHPSLGLLGPNQFIPLAEQTGVIDSLTRWVFNAAARQIRTWLDLGLRVRVAVNLASRNLHDPQIPDALARVLRTWRVPASLMVVEVTETGLILDATRAMEMLQRLRRLGIRVAIDDFGTGYSSLTYLKQLPATQIKIDQSFVQDMLVSENDYTIVRSIIDLGHNLGLKVMAEGIEDERTFNLLRELGCNGAQGYFIARPLPPEEVTARALAGEWRIAPQNPRGPAGKIAPPRRMTGRPRSGRSRSTKLAILHAVV